MAGFDDTDLSDRDDGLDIRSPALERFLLRPPEPAFRVLDGIESARRLREAFSEAAIGDDALSQYLVFALWRWSRAVATALGRCSEDETLELALSPRDGEPCPWSRRIRPRLTPQQRGILRNASTGLLYKAATNGLSLLPPGSAGGAGHTDIELWCETFYEVAKDLMLRQQPRGLDVLACLTDPSRANRVAVTKEQVWACEELVIDEFQHLMIRFGEQKAQAHIRERYGISRREALELVRLAKADAYAYGKSSVEEDRAIMVRLLQDYLARAQGTMNMTDEMRALKQLAQVQGLTRSEPEDKAAEFLGVIKHISSKQDAHLALPAVADAFNADRADVEEEIQAGAGGVESVIPDEVPYLALPAAPRPAPRTEKEAELEFDREETGR